MNHGNQANSYNEPAGPSPMTRDMNNIGECIARLEGNIGSLESSLQPVTRPYPGVPAGETKLAQVKSARSPVGDSLEGFASRIEALIARVGHLREAIEV